MQEIERTCRRICRPECESVNHAVASQVGDRAEKSGNLLKKRSYALKSQLGKGSLECESGRYAKKGGTMTL